MKRLLIGFAILLLAGAWLGQSMLEDTGYVLLAYKQTTVETSLWVLLIALILAFALLHWLVNLITHLGTPAERLRRWQARRADRKSNERTLAALKASAEGDWWRARRLFAQAAESSSGPTLLYIEAARAAAHNRDDKEAGRLLDKARSTADENSFIVEMAAAELDLELGHTERARAALERISARHPGYLQVKAQLARALQQLEDWNALSPLLPELHKAHLLSDQQVARLRRSIALARIDAAVNDTSDPGSPVLDRLTACWESLSYEARQDIDIRRTYVRRRLEFADQPGAHKLLAEWLSKAWDEQLALIFSELTEIDSSTLLKQAKGWPAGRGDDAARELVLARLSRREQLWGAAIQHYQKSISLESHAQTLTELVELYLILGQAEQALALLSGQLAPLALPEPSEADRETRLALLNNA